MRQFGEIKEPTEVGTRWSEEGSLTQVTKGIQLLLPEHVYERLRVEAHSRRVSMASVIREALASSFSMRRRPRGIEDFSFVGSGESEQGGLSPVSERHDEALEEALK